VENQKTLYEFSRAAVSAHCCAAALYIPKRGDNEMQRDFHDYHRGEIYFANLNPAFGHEQGGVRPVLILQNDVGNYYSPTVIVTAATRRCYKKPTQPTHVVLTDAEGLEPSLFILEFIRTIDKRRLFKYVGKLTEEQMQRIECALEKSFQLRKKDSRPLEMEAM
jgi:mRNA interferase MazF